MASENVERMQRAFEAFARGDLDPVAEYVNSDFARVFRTWDEARAAAGLQD